MIKYIVASKNDMESLMKIRLEMLKEVNNLKDDYMFSDELVEHSIRYFSNFNQTTILAIDEEVIGCATLSYIEIMPTFLHPTGKRAQLMNVYTNCQYRRQGIAIEMIYMLVNEAKNRGVTEVSLDATEMGRALYKKIGFIESGEHMILTIK